MTIFFRLPETRDFAKEAILMIFDFWTRVTLHHRQTTSFWSVTRVVLFLGLLDESLRDQALAPAESDLNGR